jgi:hypothetical protein
LDRAQGDHDERAAAIRAEADALEKRSHAEEARWSKEKERLVAALKRARGSVDCNRRLQVLAQVERWTNGRPVSEGCRNPCEL